MRAALNFHSLDPSPSNPHLTPLTLFLFTSSSPLPPRNLPSPLHLIPPVTPSTRHNPRSVAPSSSLRLLLPSPKRSPKAEASLPKTRSSQLLTKPTARLSFETNLPDVSWFCSFSSYWSVSFALGLSYLFGTQDCFAMGFDTGRGHLNVGWASFPIWKWNISLNFFLCFFSVGHLKMKNGIQCYFENSLSTSKLQLGETFLITFFAH